MLQSENYYSVGYVGTAPSSGWGFFVSGGDLTDGDVQAIADDALPIAEAHLVGQGTVTLGSITHFTIGEDPIYP